MTLLQNDILVMADSVSVQLDSTNGPQNPTPMRRERKSWQISTWQKSKGRESNANDLLPSRRRGMRQIS